MRISTAARTFLDGLEPAQRYAFIVGLHVGQGLDVPPETMLRQLRLEFGMEKPPKPVRLLRPSTPRAPSEPKPVKDIACQLCGATISRPPGSRGRPPTYCATCKPRNR